MTSPKSFQNNFGFAYRTGLRDNALFGVLQAAFLSLFYCIMPIMTFRDTTSTNFETGEVSTINYKELYSFLLGPSSEMMGIFRYFIIVGLLGLGLLFGIVTFRFITGKKTVNVYYSLGIKRTKLFSAKYLSGLTLIAVSVALPLVVSLIANIAVLGVNKYMITAFFYLLLGLFAVSAFSYTLTALVFTTVGTAFEGVLFSGILLLTPEILFSSLEKLIKTLVLGTPLGSNFDSLYSYNGLDTTQSLARSFGIVNPLRFFSDGIYTYTCANQKGQVMNVNNGELMDWVAPNFLPVCLWLAATAVLFVGGMFAYKCRKAEIGGFIGKNKALNFIGTFLVAFFGFVTAYSALENNGMAFALIVGAVVFAVLFALLYLMLLRNLRLFAKSLVALPIQLCITALIFVFFATGYFGAANKIPATDEVSYAKITAVQTDYSDTSKADAFSFSFSGFDSPNTLPVGKYETAKDIDFVRGIHEKLVAAGRTQPTVPDNDYNGIRPVSIKIVYVLKDGSEVLRNYYGVSDEILNELTKADETDYRQSVLDRVFKDSYEKVPVPRGNAVNGSIVSDSEMEAFESYRYIRAVRESDDIRLYNGTLSTQTKLSLTTEQRAALIDALYRDLSAQTPENHYNGKTLGLLSFDLLPEEGLDEEPNSATAVTYASPGEMYAQTVTVSENEFFGKTPSAALPEFFITEDMANTLQVLRDAGYGSALTADKELTAVYGTQVSEQFLDSYLDDYVTSYQEDFACSFTGMSSTEDHFAEFTGEWEYMDASEAPVIYKATDAATMQSIVSKATLRATLKPTDYVVILSYADGTYSKMYVHAEDMPESVKAGIAKNQSNVF